MSIEFAGTLPLPRKITLPGEWVMREFAGRDVYTIIGEMHDRSLWAYGVEDMAYQRRTDRDEPPIGRRIW